MGIFEWFRGTPRAEQPPQQPGPTEEKRVGRRQILQGAVAGAALGAAAYLSADKALAASQEKHAEAAILKTFDTRIQEIEQKYGTPGNRSMAEENRLRKEAAPDCQAFAKIAAEHIQTIQDENDRIRFFHEVEKRLAQVNGQGKFYAALEQVPTRPDPPIRIPHLPEFYGTRLQDHMLTAPMLRPEDLDPRLNLIQTVRLPDVAKKIRADIQASPGWNEPTRHAYITELLANPKIQKDAYLADLTIAEYLSLLKAVGNAYFEQSKNASTFDPATYARTLLAQYTELGHTMIFGPETKNAIVFTSSDVGGEKEENQFHPHRWKNALHAGGVPEANIQTLRPFPGDISGNKKLFHDLLTRIEQSSGKTVAVLEAHGAESSLALSTADALGIDADDLADALIERIRRTKNPKSLQDVIFIGDACYSFDFKNRIIALIRSAWIQKDPRTKKSLQDEYGGLSVDALPLPTFITSVQEKSPAVVGHKISDAVERHTGGIQRDGGLTYGRLMGMMQPEMYWFNDFSIYVSAPGRPQEIGARDTLTEKKHV